MEVWIESTFLEKSASSLKAQKTNTVSSNAYHLFDALFSFNRWKAKAKKGKKI